MMIGQTVFIIVRNFWKNLEIKNETEYINCLTNDDKKSIFISTYLGKIIYFSDVMNCHRKIYTCSS